MAITHRQDVQSRYLYEYISSSRDVPSLGGRYIVLISALLMLIPFSEALSLAAPFQHAQNPCVGCATKSSVTYYVIGTSHFRCKSATEVTNLIKEVDPDGVVVELDPERVIRLTKEGATSEEEQLFGADFLAAIDTSIEKDIPLFIGDEYIKVTKSRLGSTVLDLETYRPDRLLSSLFRRSSNSVNLLGVFTSDPLKLAPLAIAVSPPILAFLATMQNYRLDDGTGNASIFFSIVLSFFATCKVFNNLIVDRDEVLASNAINAAKVLSSLKEKETIRKRWTFTVDSNNSSGSAKRVNGKRGDEITTPLFTLKNPLTQDRTRTLNLFEPRWLNMIDSLGVTPNETPESGYQFGCVTCTNKFYSAIDVNGVEGRYADVIFKKEGAMASLTSLTEGARPSGDRKVTATIEKKGSFVVDENYLSVMEDGYLVASNITDNNGFDVPKTNRMSGKDALIQDKEKDGIKIVVVVGLLHVNGILDRLQ